LGPGPAERPAHPHGTAEVSYLSSSKPAAGGDAYTKTESDVEEIKGWIGYYLAESIHIDVKRPKDGTFSESVYSNTVRSVNPWPPIQGHPTPSLQELIIDALKTAKTTGAPQELTAGTFDPTTLSSSALMLVIGRDERLVQQSLDELKSAGKIILYPSMGRAARLYLSRSVQ
jgi:hypothetical protein